MHNIINLAITISIILMGVFFEMFAGLKYLIFFTFVSIIRPRFIKATKRKQW